MSANIVSAKRKASASKHANRIHTCSCGEVCHGNGGWSSHKKSCPVFQGYREKRERKVNYVTDKTAEYVLNGYARSEAAAKAISDWYTYEEAK